MNLSYFISKRIRESQADSFSSIIHKIAIGSIAIGLAAALISFLIMHGFQSGVKNRIYGFSNHLLVTKYTMNNAVEEQPFDFHIPVYTNPSQYNFVSHVQEYSHKAGLIKGDDEVLGVVFKGVGKSYNVTRFQESLLEGRFIHFPDSGYAHEVLLSRTIADKIEVKVGDQIVVHFFQNPPRFRKLKVVGIYETNLSEYFDGKIIVGDIRMVQQLNGWSANEAGGIEILIDFSKFKTLDLWKKELTLQQQWVKDSILENPDFSGNRWWNSILAWFSFKFDHDQAALDEAIEKIGDPMDYDLHLESVREKYIQIFEWLDLINRQVKILLVIILVVVCVNMISVILILVMERTQMVGILKAMGAQDRTVRWVFIYNGISLLTKGLLLGNIFGLGLCYLQYRFQFLKLNPHDYYMSYVPIEWSWSTVLILNVIVFATVAIVLLLPTRFVTRISPIKAIRFD